ncbi:hypothetical protein [Ruegeria arenilitoris]|uniref:hypothetical protein n=1 Tax=Ruegeria arenilitoris TaxID=1173585 RepID=UPI00147A6ABC|nr:hypothetical protein [Ruegeria arenilitoris]
MEETLSTFSAVALIVFVVVTALAYFAAKKGCGWVVMCLIVITVLTAAYWFPSQDAIPQENDDFLRFILSWALVIPAVFGAMLGGLISFLKRKT